jgi:hypothetical protein
MSDVRTATSSMHLEQIDLSQRLILGRKSHSPPPSIQLRNRAIPDGALALKSRQFILHCQHGVSYPIAQVLDRDVGGARGSTRSRCTIM